MKIIHFIADALAHLFLGPQPPAGVDETFWNRREQHMYGMTERVKKGCTSWTDSVTL